MPTSSGDDLAWLTLPARREHFDRFRGFVMGAAEALALSPGVLGKVDLVLEEILLNVMDYAYAPGHGGDMDVGCGKAPGGFFRIVIQDQGQPFNPLEQKPPDLTADIEERAVGGLGVFLTRQMADQLDYRRENDRNILEVDFKLSPAVSA